MKISAKSPCRVDMAGGTIDIWPLYLYHPGALTLNFAIDRYASCVVETRSDSKIVLRSSDLGCEESFPSLDALRSVSRYRLPLPARAVRYFAPETGLNITTHSEAPAGAGISGSSALMIALASALDRLNGRRRGIEKIREIAQNLESQVIGLPTGCQDYYPAMYGGVSAIELTEAGIERKPIAIDCDDLNERVVLAYTGAPRNSGINNWEVMKAHLDGNRAVYRNFDRIAQIAGAMRQALERGDWDQTARLVRDEWAHRRRNAPGISTPLIDLLVEAARKAGAKAAKACGAGGGGCVFFLVERGAGPRVAAVVEREGAQVLPVRVALRGVQVRVSA
ncbi:MAG: GHMP kinase [Terriglobia bacterium]|nr:MAG: GHMP kinase [Terriglobia bacterium]